MSEKSKFPAVYIGCAGWSLPSTHKRRFPEQGTHLTRYAARFNSVEINSSFYRPHRPSTYAKWAASVPVGFRFAVKIPKAITHERRLVDAERLLATFASEVSGLGEKLGCLLVQLPPSLAFQPRIARAFFKALREKNADTVVLEPRHATWFTDDAEQLLRAFNVSRVAADPAPVSAAAHPGGWCGSTYYRLHGSPRMYYSEYTDAYLTAVALALATSARAKIPTWCIFDNTALGAAYLNAFDLMGKLDATP